MSLLDQARNKQGSASDAVQWRPETPGEGVEGVVTAISYQESDLKAGVMVPWVTLLDDSGTKHSVVGFRTVLRNEITEQDPKVGDRMAAVYTGTDVIKKGPFKGRDVHIYRVVVEHKNGAAPVTAPQATVDDSRAVPF